MTTTVSNPVQQLAAAESRMAASINALADAIDSLGSHQIAAAQRRLRRSIEDAKDRLLDAQRQAMADVGELVAFAENLAFSVEDDVSHIDWEEPAESAAVDPEPAQKAQCHSTQANGRLAGMLGGLLGTTQAEEIRAHACAKTVAVEFPEWPESPLPEPPADEPDTEIEPAEVPPLPEVDTDHPPDLDAVNATHRKRGRRKKS